MQLKNNSHNNNNRSSEPRNTDNEKTMFFAPQSDNCDTAELENIRYNTAEQYGSSENSYRQNQGYNKSPQTPGRMNYYNSGQSNPQQRAPQQRPPQQRPTQQRAPQQRPPQQRPTQQRPSQQRPPQQRPTQQRPSQQRPPQQRPPQKRPSQQRPPQQNSSAKQKSNKNKNKRRTPFIVKLLISLLIPVVLVFSLYSCASLSVINKLNHQETGTRTYTNGSLYKSYVKNVLVIGTDGRTLDERGRSDTMILVSINSRTNKIFLTSLMRDAYVEIPGRGWNKLNASYSYGGAELLMDTIEKNFDIRIDDYVSINFNSFASIVDSVGGIEIEVSDAEAREINTILMAEVNELMGDAVDADLLSGGGVLKLNGKQALSYARIRHIGNADFERTQRQRDVIAKIVEKLKSFNPSIITEIAQNAVPQVTTNMSTAELYALSLRLPFLLGYDLEQLRIPAEGLYGNTTTSDGGSALSIDFVPNINILRENIFTDK